MRYLESAALRCLTLSAPWLTSLAIRRLWKRPIISAVSLQVYFWCHTSFYWMVQNCITFTKAFYLWLKLLLLIETVLFFTLFTNRLRLTLGGTPIHRVKLEFFTVSFSCYVFVPAWLTVYLLARLRSLSRLLSPGQCGLLVCPARRAYQLSLGQAQGHAGSLHYTQKVKIADWLCTG